VLQVTLISGEGADRVFRCIENCRGWSAANTKYFMFGTIFLHWPHRLNEVIFKTGFRKMQVDLFFFIQNFATQN